MHSPRRAERDPELEKYLARVEELDNERNGSKTTNNEDLNNNSKYRPQDLEISKKLLNGEYPVLEDKFAIPNLGRTSEMAYRSAYNYEKSFSPKRNSNRQNSPIRADKQSGKRSYGDHTDISVSRFDFRDSGRQYTISEEDYILLTQLKQGLIDSSSPQLKEEVKKYPSRGKARVTRDSPPSSSRPTKHVENYGSDYLAKDDPTPPPLPLRKRVDASTTFTTPSKTAPVKPPRPQTLHSASDNFIDKPSSLPDPSLPRSALNEVGTTPSKAGSNSYLTSLQKNKVTATTPSKLDLSLKLTGGSRIPETPLSSAQNNKVTTMTSHNSQVPKTPPQKPNRPPRSFVTSALKGESSKTEHLGKPLKIPPPRKHSIEKNVPNESTLELKELKLKLRNAETQVDNNRETQTGTGILSDVKLSVPKTRKSTTDDKILAIQRQQALRTPPAAPERKVSEPEVVGKRKSLIKAPPKPERKPSVPEALNKRESLTKAPPKPAVKASLPEAVSKLSCLSKAPPKPARKISMPEALQRLERMKSKNLKEGTIGGDSGYRDKIGQHTSNEEEEAIILARKLKNSQNNKTTSVSKLDNNVPIAVLPTAQAVDVKLARLLRPATEDSAKTLEPSQSNINSLAHPTKGRARGPKRKPPKTV
ncbi:Bsp1p LALA0_S13e00628g [Lachancea lanzarotensis]|uniref:LALA0S13e00628g1_1 n=1 Tax=Lachancea lanzarotensis TaxID=1245769 RepID=A0A0C7N3D2_9SACH|nr:uncharacterized protein LALA0_S13e00628g [Lachancea lanzarotensis]CEP64685.1 LALA0S13e00628g1_1 [Lachancea lanzarotensis]